MLKIITDDNACEHVYTITRNEFDREYFRDCDMTCDEQGRVCFVHRVENAIFYDMTYNEYKSRIAYIARHHRDFIEHKFHGYFV